ncbi:Poly(A) RNA polymerase cid14 [Spatholobus suberectus]|nr:Poly(A) RNA polymerase cid14 [Spatholobus suberectus]
MRQSVVEGHYSSTHLFLGLISKVFPYGSVPLKTYLPDGDIDLTALSCQNIEDGLVSDVRAVLHGEEINEAAEYEVKDVRFIDAEVKLVKCIVQNIVVDISFNQLGGLSTLCFLEKVDRLVAKDHLFKRSIILIKAWCYYESRVLGAHHGLISTYALETLVLYIFHQFYVSLDGPLAVLYRFLDYFSKFDWDNYCVSLKGPVSKSSLPNIVAEVPENGGNTLLTEEFIRSCVESFAVPSRGADLNLRAFPQKHLNIIDPLKENNNLGRSVNKGNYFRIRSAFKYGARKLGWILMLPEDRIPDELVRFFANTLERHGSTQGNVDKSILSLSTAFKKDWKPGNQLNYENRDERERYIVQDAPSLAGEFFDSSGDGNAVASFKLSENSKDVAKSGVLDIASTNGSSYCLNGQFEIENSISSSEPALNSVIDDEKEKQGTVSNSPRSHADEKNMASYGSAVSTDANILENNFFHSNRHTTSVSGGTEASKSLLDLAGDYDSHIGNLQYGQMCNGYPVSPVAVPSPPRSPKFPNRNPWETVRQCVQINHSIRSQTNSNCVMGQQVYVINHPTLPMTSFGSEEKRKVRGTGAYFPNMTSRPYRDNRPMPGRGRGQAPGTHGHLQRHTHNNGLALAPQEMNLSAEGTSEHLEGYPALGSTKTRSYETYFPQPSTWGSHYANGFLHTSEKHESGSVSPQLRVAPRTELSNYPDSGISTSRGTVPNTGVVTEESSNALSLVDSKSGVFGGVRGHSNCLDDGAPEKHVW